jgi:hypothetical protein
MATVLERVIPAKAKKPEAGTVHWFNECVERGKRERFSEEVTVTPGLASVILGNNPDNRNLSATKLTQFAADMRAGRWRGLNGETIQIAKTGELNNGQHRLNALIDANVSLPLIFMFGLEREDRLTVDQGGARTAGHYLTMVGAENAIIKASVARQLIAYERSKGQSLGGACYVTNGEVLERVVNDQSIGEAAHFASAHAKAARQYAAPAIIGFCYYVLADISSVEADEYMRQVCDGEGLKKKDPAYTVRDRLLALGKGRNDKVHVIFRGWNAYRQQRQLSIAKIIVSSGLPALV